MKAMVERVDTIMDQFTTSITAHALTTLYLLASATIVAGFADRISLTTSLIVISACALTVGFVAQHRENRITRATIEVVHSDIGDVHALVNQQHDDLVERVAQLIAALEHADVAVPAEKEPQ